MTKQAFPKGFLWGASTAAHQVEGNNHNQWTEWEKANAERLAQTAPDRLGWLPGWPEVRIEAMDPDNYRSGNAVAHYDQFAEDFELLKELNMNAYRFSIEWSRIEPQEGVWDEKALAYYKKYLAALKAAGIEPIVTFWHWTMPVWFADMGGFERRQNLRYFLCFVRTVVAALGADFRYLALLNEPNSYMGNGYLAGEWPPQRHNPFLGICVYRNLMLAHNQSYKICKELYPELQVGIAMAMAEIRPTNTHSLVNQLTVRIASWVGNWWFMNGIKKRLDFIGVNFYFTTYLNWRGQQRNPAKPVSDLGWYMEPSGIENVLIKTWQRYKKPILIIENGLADGEDKQRKWWIEETIAAMQRALAKGVDLRGYLHWSLLDNFEWAFGWWPKFGLIAVDRKTMKRTIRPSARWFADYLARNKRVNS